MVFAYLYPHTSPQQSHVDSLMCDSYPDKVGRLDNLGLSLLRQYERLGILVDVNEAITSLQAAVRLIPDP